MGNSYAAELAGHYASVRERLMKGPPPQKKTGPLPLPMVLPPLDDSRESYEPAGARIMREVAEKHGLRKRDLLTARRPKPIVMARQECWWRMANETDMSLPAMGKLFGGMDHTTVLHGIRRHAARLAGGAA